MSILFIALILISAIVLIVMLLVWVNNHAQNNKRERIYKHLKDLAATNEFSFTSQEIFGRTMMALDGINRKLVVITENEDVFETTIIRLEEVQYCKVKKDYSHLIREEARATTAEILLNGMSLQFVFNSNNDDFTVKIYDINTHSFYQIPGLEEKAKNWEIILNKLIKTQEQLRA